jgi:hypothetical protein
LSLVNCCPWIGSAKPSHCPHPTPHTPQPLWVTACD